MGSAHLICVSSASSWSLRGRSWFLRGVFVVFDMVDCPRIHQGSYISIFRSLPSWEVLHLLCVSRASSWSLRGCLWFLRGGLVVFGMVDVRRIPQGSYNKFSDLYTPVSVQLCQDVQIFAKFEFHSEVLLHWAAYAAKNLIPPSSPLCYI